MEEGGADGSNTKASCLSEHPAERCSPHIPHRGLLTSGQSSSRPQGQKKLLELHPHSEKGQGHDTCCLGSPKACQSLEDTGFPVTDQKGSSHAVVHIIGTFYGPLWVAAGCRTILWAPPTHR